MRTSEQLKAALAEPAAHFRPLLAASDWAADAAALLQAPEHPMDGGTGGSSSVHGPLCALSPVVAALRSRITRAYVGEGAGRERVCARATLTAAYERPLKYRLLDQLLPAFIINLHQAKASGYLKGDTPEERYDDFIRLIHTAEWRRAFFREYPIIARMSATMGLHAAASAEEFISRLDADWADIQREFSFADDDEVKEIRVTGDLHDRFRAVLLLEMASGASLLYKPRSLTAAFHFQGLIAWMNEHGFDPPLRTLKVLPRNGYGWEEFVASRECKDGEQTRRFYERQGALTALLYAVAASDVHSENIIAAGEHPVLVDHETLFQPDWPRYATNREDRASKTFATSLVADTLWNLALLPDRRYSRDGSPGVDISGLGGGDSGLGPLRVPRVVNAGRDDISMELHHPESAPHQNRPKLGEELLSVHDFRTELLSGFRKACEVLYEQKVALLADEGPFAAFASDRTRVILRPTATYSLLLTSLGRPELTRDGAVKDMYLDRFLSSGVSWRAAAEIAEAERAELWFGDVPAFYSRARSMSLWTGTGHRIDRFFPRSGYEVARRRVAKLNGARIDALSWEIESAIDCSTATADINAGPVRRLKPATARKLRTSIEQRAATTGLREQAIALAEELGRHISRLSRDLDEYVTWPRIVDGDASVVVQPAMGPDLYDGLVGVGLFLAYLGEQTGLDEYRHLAHRAQKTAGQFIDLFSGHWGASAFNGQGAYLYLVLHLSSIWGDRSLLRECAERSVALGDQIQEDDQYDFIRGVAGLVPILLGLHEANPNGEALELAKVCGRHLVRGARTQACGVAWVPTADEGITPALLGMGHGAGGIACSLMRLFRATSDQQFRRVAIEALVYERSMFDAHRGDWPDLRRPPTTDDETHHPRIAAWCHGATGIGLEPLTE